MITKESNGFLENIEIFNNIDITVKKFNGIKTSPFVCIPRCTIYTLSYFVFASQVKSLKCLRFPGIKKSFSITINKINLKKNT
jgi:hypothetical protein